MRNSPFIIKPQKTRQRFKTIATSTVEILDKNTGELKPAFSLIGSNRKYDSSDFIKLYDTSFLLKLSQHAIAVLAFLLNNLQFDGYANFSYKQALLFTHYNSRQSLFRGLKQLMQLNIIAKKQKGEYWINPNLAFRGQRPV